MKSFHDRDFVVQKTTDFRLNKYDVGGYMSKHCDNIHHSHGQKWGYPHVTILLYLNDDYVGGHTQFDNIHGGVWYDVKPKTGKLLIFSNREYLHHVSRVQSGTRYVLSFWFNALVPT